MTVNDYTTMTKTSPKELVGAFLHALNDEDFTQAKKCVSADMKFVGVMGSRNGADAYFADMEHMKLKYDVKKTFADGNDVCVFYDITMQGKKIYSCGWYHIKLDKINSFRVIFDPRPLLEEKKS